MSLETRHERTAVQLPRRKVAGSSWAVALRSGVLREEIERIGDGPNVVGREVEIDSGHGELGVTEESLNAEEIDSGLEKMSCEGVTKGMRRDALGEAGDACGPRDGVLDRLPANGFVGVSTGEEPRGVDRLLNPVGPKAGEESSGERDLALPRAFAVDADDAARGVEVGGAKEAKLGEPYAGGVEGGDEGVIVRELGSAKESGDLGSRKNDREFLRSASEWDEMNREGIVQGDAVEKAQGADGEVESGVGSSEIDSEMNLIGPDLFGSEK